MKPTTRWLLILILIGMPLSLLLMGFIQAEVNLLYKKFMLYLYGMDQGVVWFFLLGIITFMACIPLFKKPALSWKFKKKRLLLQGL